MNFTRQGPDNAARTPKLKERTYTRNLRDS